MTRRTAPLAAAAAGAALACLCAAAALAGSTRQAHAETGLAVPATCAAPADGAVLRLNVLILLDNSGSLARNDPGLLRAQGAKDAVLVLDSLSTRRAGHAEVRIAIDSFNTGYERGAGWIDAAGSSRRLIGRIDPIAAIPEGRTLTDYTAAMRGAATRFAEAGEGCNLLVWFTDGEHVTHGTAAEVDPEEWSQLNELCQGAEMDRLRRTAWTGAVRLRAGGDEGGSSGETLRHLFGGGLGCAHALRGDVYDDFAPADLGRLLHDVIAMPAEDLLFRADPHKLPGEPDDPPTEPEYQPCAGGDGAPESPCRLVFGLGRDDESFRLFVDLTFLRRGIRNPSDLDLVLRSPGGRLSEVLHGGAESVEAGTEGRYRALAPFGFHSRAHYPGELEILGHRVAETGAGGATGGWRWRGEWSLLVSGETPQAQADARRAAMAVRKQAAAAPAADSLGIDSDGTLSGFLAGYPSQYDEVALHIRVDGADGAPLYATRPSVTGGPVTVDGQARRFTVPSFLDLLVEWDSPSGGGNGRNLREALAGSSPAGGTQPGPAAAGGPARAPRAGVGATAVLTQTLRYPGPPDSPATVWRRDVGAYRLSPAEGAEVVRRIDGHAALEELLGALSDSSHAWLPGRLALGEPRLNIAAGAATLWVSAVPGAVAGTLTLALDGDSALGSVESLDPLRPETGRARLWAAPWNCRVPSAQDHRASSLDGPYQCPAPLRLGMAAPHDTEFTAGLDIEVVEEAGTVDRLLAPLWFAPGRGGAAPVEARLEAALGRERRVQRLVSAPFVLDVPEPPAPVAASDVLAEFLPMAAVLAAAAATARLAMAWRLRPWPALGSADYAVAQLQDPDSIGALQPPADVERGIRMDLLRPAAAARIEGVRIRSRWWPLLLGRERSVVARVRAARCFGPKGRLRSPLRRGSRARIGTDIDRGWVATASGDGLRLVVWDLPADERSAQEHLQNAGRDASSEARRLAEADRPRRRRARRTRRARRARARPSADVGTAPPAV